MTSPLFISVLVLRSFLTTTKVPANSSTVPANSSTVPANSSTVKPPITPTSKTHTSSTVANSSVPSIREPWLTESASTWVDIRLVTRKGIHLIMFANGTVAGTWNSSLTTIFGLFRIQSHGPGIVKLKSLTTMKYIAISNVGHIYSTANSSNEETLLKHAQEENHFYSFSSFLYPTDQTHVTRKWLLAIGSNGRIRNASRVLPRHKSHQFQINEIGKNTKMKDLLSALLRLKESRGK